jgi:5'-nucleotidase
VTVNLSSLEFSRTETAAGTVAVTFGGATIGTGTVVRAYTPTVDEIGTATVTFQVPAGTSGPTRFGITTPVGTTSSFVINVG